MTALLLALLEPGQTVALAEGGYFGTGVMIGRARPLGARHVEFDQTGPPPEGVDLVWLEAPSNPFLTMPDLEAAAAHPAPRGRRLHRGDAGLPAPARARRRLRRSTAATKYLTGHSDALVGAVVCARRGRARAALALPPAHRPDLRARRRLRSSPAG